MTVDRLIENVIDLNDIPHAYTGFAEYGLAVNVAEDAMEFAKFATEDYVNEFSVNTGVDFFGYNVASGDIVGYLQLNPTVSPNAEETLVVGVAGNAVGQLLGSWATEVGCACTDLVNTLTNGIYQLHAQFSAATANRIKFYVELYVRDALGAEDLILTSDPTDFIGIVKEAHDMLATLLADRPLVAGDRLVIKGYATNASPAATNITIYMEGDTGTRITIKGLAAPRLHDQMGHLAFADAGHTGFQAQGDVLDDLNTLGAVGADSEFLVGTGIGAFAWESGATVRTSMGVYSTAESDGLITTHETTYDHDHYDTAYGWGDHAGLYAAASHAMSTHSDEDTYNIATTGTASIGDANFKLALGGTQPYILFDATDTFAYERTTDTFHMIIASATAYTFNDTEFDATNNNITTTGTVTGSNLNVADWDTAYGWGDHAGLYIAVTFVDTKGDLISASADDTPVILGVGGDGEVLTADSGETSGLKWSAAGSGTVDTSGVPVANDFARFTDADTIEGLDYEETLAALSGSAGAAFDWNNANLTSVGAVSCGAIGCGTITSASGYISAQGGDIYIGVDLTTGGELHLYGEDAGGSNPQGGLIYLYASDTYTGTVDKWTIQSNGIEMQFKADGNRIMTFDATDLDVDFHTRALVDVGAITSTGTSLFAVAGVGIARTDGTLHVHTATAGAVAAPADADDLVIENSGNGGFTILTPDASKGYVNFGCPTSPSYTYLEAFYNAGSAELDFNVGGLALTLNDSHQAIFAGVVGMGMAPNVVVGCYIAGVGATAATYSLACDDGAAQLQFYVRDDGAAWLIGKLTQAGCPEFAELTHTDLVDRLTLENIKPQAPEFSRHINDRELVTLKDTKEEITQAVLEDRYYHNTGEMTMTLSHLCTRQEAKIEALEARVLELEKN